MKKIIFIISILLMVTGLAMAHQGRTDSHGGHKNTKTGRYECHTCSSTTTRRSFSPSTKASIDYTKFSTNIPAFAYGNWKGTTTKSGYSIIWNIFTENGEDIAIGYLRDETFEKDIVIVDCRVQNCMYKTRGSVRFLANEFVIKAGRKKYELMAHGNDLFYSPYKKSFTLKRIKE